MCPRGSVDETEEQITAGVASLCQRAVELVEVDEIFVAHVGTRHSVMGGSAQPEIHHLCLCVCGERGDLNAEKTKQMVCVCSFQLPVCTT